LLNTTKNYLGKLCKTGRPFNYVPPTTIATQNNNNPITTTATTIINNNHTIKTPASAPLQTNSSSTSPSSSTTPAEPRLVLSHPSSALGTQQQSISSKNSIHPVSLRLRREMTQPVLNRVELISSLDSPLEKIAANDSLPFQLRLNNTNKLNQNQQSDLRCKQFKINPSRLSVDYVPVRQISRSRVNDCLPSPKGKKTKLLFHPSFLQKDLLFLNFCTKN
jgi:hypothetical protein